MPDPSRSATGLSRPVPRLICGATAAWPRTRPTYRRPRGPPRLPIHACWRIACLCGKNRASVQHATLLRSTGRPTATILERYLKQPVIVVNRAGAGGAIGMAAVAKAPPDGYTLLMALSSISIIPVAERLFDRGLTLPSGSGMTEDQFDRVLDLLDKALP